MQSAPPIAAAVVSWNTRELLLACLDSLADAARAGRAEVWVVDNDSGDGSAGAARRHAPWARVVEAQANLGFGAAVDLVARRTHTPWLLAANADIALEPGALDALLAAGADARTGCAAPRLLLPDGSTQHSVHPFPTIALTAAFNLGLHRVDRRVGDRLCLEGFWNPDRPRPVPWAIGACLLLRRQAYDEVGGFDERHWMYAEDLDLGWRLHRRGWVTRYVPAARVRHHASAATAVAFGEERAPRFMAETYALLRRQRGSATMVATGTVNIAGAAARLLWALLRGPWGRDGRAVNRRWLRAHVHGLRAALR